MGNKSQETNHSKILTNVKKVSFHFDILSKILKGNFMKLYLSVLLLLTINLHANENTFYAAVESVDIKPAIGIPLAGYGSAVRRLKPMDWKNKYPHSFFFKPSTGRRDPIRSKTMIIKKGDKKLVFISLDVIGVTANFIDDLALKTSKLGISREELFVSATHTHSGPGTLSKNIGLSLVAVDFFKKDNYDYFLSQVYKNIIIALDNLEPVELYSSSFNAVGIQVNKWRKQGENWFDSSAKFLLAKSIKNSNILGGMLNFAVHGNAMPIEDMRYSADFPGAIERATERKINLLNSNKDKFPTILFMNGAEGDVKHNGERGEEIMENIAEDFALQAQKYALKTDNLKLIEGDIKYLIQDTFIAIPAYPLKVCAVRDGFYGNWMKVIPGKASRIPLVPFFPTYSQISVAKIGDISFASWPGEASTWHSFDLKNRAKEIGHTNLWFLGLTNDYLTYFTNKDEFYEGEYDSCSSFYGYKGGKRISKRIIKMLNKL